MWPPSEEYVVENRSENKARDYANCHLYRVKELDSALLGAYLW